LSFHTVSIVGGLQHHFIRHYPGTSYLNRLNRDLFAW
jgi:hypothetical protein